MSDALCDNLTLFGHQKFKHIEQKEAVQAIFEGNHDVFINMPSGFGKSLCYQLPLVSKGNKFAIVISRTLMNVKKKVKYLQSINIVAYSWDKNSPKNTIQCLQRKMTTETSNLKFLYVTSKVCELPYFQMFLSKINESRLHCIVVDEAHCVSPRSHDFNISYFKLNKLRQTFPHTPIVAITSTATKKVKDDIFKLLDIKNPLIFFLPEFRANLYYDIEFTDLLLKQNVNPQDHLKNFIIQILGSTDLSQPKETRDCGIIFCQQHDISLKLCEYLTSNGISAVYLDKKSKIQQQVKLMQLWDSGEMSVIITTSSFGIGIAKCAVRFVVHWGTSSSIGSYYQESGRAGHDGKLSFCRIYVNTREKFDEFKRNSGCIKTSHCSLLKDYMKSKLQLYKKFESTLTSLTCRHANFAEYFGNSSTECRCDICSKSISVQKTISEYDSVHVKVSNAANLPAPLLLSQNSLIQKFNHLQFLGTVVPNNPKSINVSSKIDKDKTVSIVNYCSRASLAKEKIMKKRKVICLSDNSEDDDNSIIILDELCSKSFRKLPHQQKSCPKTCNVDVNKMKDIKVSHLLLPQTQILSKLKKNCYKKNSVSDIKTLRDNNISHILLSQMQILKNLKRICNKKGSVVNNNKKDFDVTYFEENLKNKSLDSDATDFEENMDVDSDSSVIIIDDKKTTSTQELKSADVILID